MRTRVLPLLSSLMLIGAASIAAGDDPAQPAPPKYVRVSYDVRDLIVPDGVAAASPAGQALMLSDLITTITLMTGQLPGGVTTWRYVTFPRLRGETQLQPITNTDAQGDGAIGALSSSLIISQTPEVQADVAELLKSVRDSHGIKVSLETRFLVVDETFLKDLKISDAATVPLDDGQTAAVLKASGMDHCLTIGAPRLLLGTAETGTASAGTGGLRAALTLNPVVVSADHKSVQLVYQDSQSRETRQTTMAMGRTLLINAGKVGAEANHTLLMLVTPVLLPPFDKPLAPK